MSDDWRLRIDLHDDRAAVKLTELLEKSEHELEGDFDDRVVVSRDGSEVFCYTGTRSLAERVEALVRSLASENGWEIETDLRRWHPAAEEWEDPDKPLPTGPDESAEHAELIEREREEVAERGYPEFEVRVELPSHRDAVAFVEKLREEGLPYVQRWKYVLIGASDEDAAAALAQRLRVEAPPGSKVQVEGTWQALRAELPFNRFAVFGGMAG
ncbi:MAG TPA: hypothetical protein VG295_00405 [Solirubrobacteraceae bacterium]|nr:hypothetical protein [Solirubrobacteraceae bacterium]